MRRLARRLVNRALARVGLELRQVARYEPLVPGYPHARVAPTASYAPWLGDAAFNAVHRRIAGHTLVDVYRCWELWQLVGELAWVPGDLLEVGVWRGGTGALLAARAQAEGLPAAVHLCDTFRGVVKAGERDSLYRGGEHADTTPAIVEQLLADLRLTQARVHVGVFPEETGHVLADVRLRLCHVDVDVHDSAREVLRWAWPRLSPGGVVVFDDYGFRGCEGITRLVEDEARGPGRIAVHNLNGHALLIKLAEAT